MTREEAAETIRQSELSSNADAIIPLLLPSIQVKATRIRMGEMRLGASRMGGDPDVPPDFDWPKWTTRVWEIDKSTNRPVHSEPRERYLHFIAQLNLAELRHFAPNNGLPSQGLLSFFCDLAAPPGGYDPAEDLGSRVIFFETLDQPLTRRSHPTPDSQCATFPCKLELLNQWTIPDWGYYDFDRDDGLDAIVELKQWLDPNAHDTQAPLHRVLGWPETIQGDMQLECQLVSHGLYCGNVTGYRDPRAEALRAGAQDWLLLLQIDSDEHNPGWMWGDCGRIYYWIHKNDLAERRFEKARMIMQCY